MMLFRKKPRPSSLPMPPEYVLCLRTVQDRIAEAETVDDLSPMQELIALREFARSVQRATVDDLPALKDAADWLLPSRV